MGVPPGLRARAMHAAIALLSIAGSEAAVERSFSAQDIVHSKRRNRLKDDAVEQEVFIRFNSSILERQLPRQRQEHYIDLRPDAADGDRLDSIRHVSGLFASFADAAAPVLVEEGKQSVEEAEADAAAVELDVDGPPVVVQLEGALPDPVSLLDSFLTYFIQKYNIVPASVPRGDGDLTLTDEMANFSKGAVKDTIGEVKKKMRERLRPAPPSITVVVPVLS